MKNKIKVVLITVFSLLLCACSGSPSDNSSEISSEAVSGNTGADVQQLSSDSRYDIYESNLAELQYPVDGLWAFGADGSGGVVCLDQSYKLERYSADGALTESYDVPSNIKISSIACTEDKIYILGKYNDVFSVGEFGKDGYNELYSNSELQKCAASNIIIQDENLFFSTSSGQNITVVSADGDHEFDKTQIYKLDISSGNCISIEAENPICFTADPDNDGIIFYGCDTGGFYFARYNGELSERQYRDLGYLSSFCMIGKDMAAYYSYSGINTSRITGDDFRAVLVNENIYNSPLTVSQGCLIYMTSDKTGENRLLKRIAPRGNIKNFAPIDIIMTVSNSDVIGDTGYALNVEYIDETELALKLLSQDTDWDAVLFYSRIAAATEIANQCVFHPLNEQAESYVSECIPAVKDICTKDGNIWAVPVETNIAHILYNTEKCGEYGIDFSNISMEEFLKKSRELCEDPELRGTAVNLYWETLAEIYINSSIGSRSLDSEKFKNSLALMKEYTNTLNPADYMQRKIDHVDSQGTQWGAGDNLVNGDVDNFLYKLESSDWATRRFLADYPDVISVASVPFEGTIQGYSFLLAVNPKSDNLQKTLEYVGAMCADLLEKKHDDDNSQIEGIQKLNEIYENSGITMGVPDELYIDDYHRYLKDEITLDEFVTEVNRKLSTYYNE